MTCEDCVAAQENPQHGIFRSSCTGCITRALSRRQEFFACLKDRQRTPEYDAALRTFFGDDQPAQDIRHEQVKRWYRQQKGNK